MIWREDTGNIQGGSTVKAAHISIFLILGVCTAYAQVAAQRLPVPADSPGSAEEYHIQGIKRLMSMPSPLKFGQIDLNRMGDEASTDVLKILGTNPSLTSEQQKTVLDIVHMSFEHPAAILNPADKKPLAATFLLRFLRNTTQDEAVKARVTTELEFVQKAAALPAVMKQ